MNLVKLFEIENGLDITGGIALTTGDASPLSLTPPKETKYIENRGVEWFYSNGWNLAQYLNIIDAHVINYTSGNVSSVVYNKAGVRVFQVDVTLTGDKVTKEEQSLFATNGTTLVRKITLNYTYTGDDLTSFTKAET
jgi:hypothetical protein